MLTTSQDDLLVIALTRDDVSEHLLSGGPGGEPNARALPTTWLLLGGYDSRPAAR
jgi:hypothetical protein